MLLKLPAFSMTLTRHRDGQQPHGEQQHPAPGAHLHRHDRTQPHFAPAPSKATAASRLVPSQGRLHVTGQQERACWGLLVVVGFSPLFLPLRNWDSPRLGWMKRKERGVWGSTSGSYLLFFVIFSAQKIKSHRMEGSELLQLE